MKWVSVKPRAPVILLPRLFRVDCSRISETSIADVSCKTLG